jgi:CubicO group peptidase (beta-lactamase class C family)
MNRRRFLASSTAAAVGLSVELTPLQGRPSAKRNPDLDLDRWREVTQVPGIAVAGRIGGSPVAIVSGVKRAGSDEPVTAGTVFPAASLSKPVFALAVRQLVKAGKLAWDKPLQDYLDLGLAGDAARITAAHVLSHATGLPNWRFQPDEKLTAVFSPGSRWQYSGEGFVLLQRAVEAIAGAPIAAFMKKTVLDPLGMTSSTFAWTPAIEVRAVAGHNRRGALLEKSLGFYAKQNHDVLAGAALNPETASYDEIAAAYTKGASKPLPIAISPNVAGSLMTTPADYARFLSAIEAEAREPGADFRPRVDVNSMIGWTLGFGVDRTSGSPALFQWGDGPGFKHLAWVRPGSKTAIAFFTNGDNGAALYGRVFRQLLGEDPATLYWV